MHSNRTDVRVNLRPMKLTVQIRLLPNPAQEAALRGTLRLANDAANLVAEVAWQRRAFRFFDLQRITYGQVRALGLSAQASVRVIKKVADAYTLDCLASGHSDPMLHNPTTIAVSPGSPVSRP